MAGQKHETMADDDGICHVTELEQSEDSYHLNKILPNGQWRKSISETLSTLSDAFKQRPINEDTIRIILI